MDAAKEDFREKWREATENFRGRAGFGPGESIYIVPRVLFQVYWETF